MNVHQDHARIELLFRKATLPSLSPLSSPRVRSLAQRLIEGAPALTTGEMRELAEAVLEHQISNGRQDE